mgnify:CR=1 FL=1
MPLPSTSSRKGTSKIRAPQAVKSTSHQRRTRQPSAPAAAYCPRTAHVARRSPAAPSAAHRVASGHAQAERRIEELTERARIADVRTQRGSRARSAGTHSCASSWPGTWNRCTSRASVSTFRAQASLPSRDQLFARADRVAALEKSLAAVVAAHAGKSRCSDKSRAALRIARLRSS